MAVSKVYLSAIVKLVITARDEDWTDAEIKSSLRLALGVDELDLVVDEASEMAQTMVGPLLDDFERKTEDWCLVVSPLGDSMGWRAAILVGDVQAQLGGASASSWSEATALAFARSTAALEALVEEANNEP